jgi:hypothetical protein
MKESQRAEGLFTSEFHAARIKENPRVSQFNDYKKLTECTNDELVEDAAKEWKK